MFASKIEKVLKIPKRHQARTGLLFLFSFGMTGAYVGARSDADAVFLARVGIEKLPAMILVSASGVAIVTALYAKILPRLSLQRVIFATHLLFAISTLTLALMLESGDRSIGIPVSLYLLAELRGAFGSIQFATLLNEMFHSAAPSRITGIASSGSTISAVILGGLIGWLAAQFGATSVLYMIAVMDVVAGCVALRCRRDPTTSDEGIEQTQPATLPVHTDQHGRTPTTSVQILKQVPLARYLAGIVFLKTIVVLLIEFEWKSTTVAYFSAEDDLASFFGVFYAVTALLTGCLQLFVTSRFLARFGVQAGLASFPTSLTLLLSTILFAAKPMAIFWCLTLARGCDVLRRGLTDTALNVLYWPLGPALRRQVIALNGGWVKPLTEAFAAVLLIPLTATLSYRGLALTIASLCVVWLVVIYRGRYPAAREPKQP